MKTIKSLILLAVIAFAMPNLAVAQNAKPSAGQSRMTWNDVDSLMVKQYYDQAYSKAEKKYDEALKRGDSRQCLVGAYYLSRIGSAYRENATDTALMRFRSLLPLLDDADRAVCRVLLADYYMHFFSHNSWSLNQNSPSDEADLELGLWTSARLHDTVALLLRQALSNPALLRSVPPDSLGWLVTVRDGGDGNLTPTLYDVLVRKSMGIIIELNFSPLLESDIDRPELLYAECERFATARISCRDSSRSMAAFALQVLQEWESESGKRNAANVDRLMTELYTTRTEWVNSLLNVDYNRRISMRLQQLPQVIARYRSGNDASITMLYSQLAELLYEKSRYLEAIAAIDTALALHPDSPGAAKCYNLRGLITAKKITIWQANCTPSGEPQLAVATTRNVDHLYFRIVRSFDYYRNHKVERRRQLVTAPVLKQWDQPIAMRNDYKPQKTYVVIPPMEQGEYYLLVSNTPDFDTFGISLGQLNIQDVVFLPAYGKNTVNRGFVVDRKSGKPIAGQKVTLQSTKNYRNFNDVATVKTDRDGYYDFTPVIKNNWNRLEYKEQRVVTTYKGYRNTSSGMTADRDIRDNPSERTFRFFTDRPVYKPGDTVSFAFLAAYADRYNGGVLPGMEVRFELVDINGKLIDTLLLKTDQYGLCDGRFALPADAMPGQWRIRTGEEFRHETAYLKVEAYKQPKFTVTLSKPAEVRRFGQKARVEGIASSYTAVPVSGATVEYTVTRVERRYYYRGWMDWNNTSNSKVVAEGETVTADDGSFAVEFVPWPDSNSDLNRKPSYDYRVNAKVTDINGETHEASTSLLLGLVNSYASVSTKTVDRDDVTLTVGCYNLDGKPIDGTADIKVVRLATPEKPLLSCRTMQYDDSSIAMPLGRKEFERLFPSFDYDGTASDYQRWPVEKQVFSTIARTTADKPYVYDMKGLAAGAYRLTATVRTDSGDTLTTESTLLYQPSTAEQPQLSKLITADIESSTVEVGDRVRLRVGSRYPDITVFLLVNKDQVSYTHRLVKLNCGYAEVEIPVTDSLLGGFRIEVAAVCANQIAFKDFDIEVPYSDKQLDVAFDLETFRNKLEPGSGERWTLNIKEKKTGLPAAANLMMTMYDHALDTYGALHWGFNPWRQSYTPTSFADITWTDNSFYDFAPAVPYRDIIPYLFRTSFLNSAFSTGFYRHNRMYKTATARGESGFVVMAEKEPVIEIGVPESGQRLAADDIQPVNSIVASVAGVGYIDSDAEVTNELQVVDDEGPVESKSKDPSESNSDEPQLRQNLNTLAFFRPALRSGSDGRVQLSFTVPELLTEWSINGIAYTKDLKTGTIAASAITQKRLMVTPNVPRFLRHGDTCLFSVKVSNLSDKEQTVNLSLQMTNAVTGQPIAMVVGESAKRIVLNSGASGEVSFLLAVPRQPLFVANYKVIARGDGVSDGEQGPIPLLPGRQLVTESMAFYINGAGEKEFELKHLTETAKPSADDIDWTLKNHSLTVDITPNPIWLAIQSLPYVKQQQNPSNIYLANAIYTNSLSFSIVNNNPQIEQLFRQWEQNEPEAFQSALDRNTDLKQTVMEGTPWLNDAVSEEQRHRDVARFFNRTTLSRQLQKDLDRLLAAQRSDGGWSWIDGGRFSSLYTTQYILKSFGHLRQQGVELDSRTLRALDRAMDYVDRETYEYYIKYIKKHSDTQIANLDYLYLRSLYPDNHLGKRQQEAYNFFYTNAKKYNKDYRSLFTQAMLAVVFQRAGDTILARDMATRIRQKALYSDEMGMYWRDNTSGWSWSERPIETQAMLIRTFDEVLRDSESIARMQQWLLKQKQTTNWNTDVSTVNAIQALLLSGKRKAESGERKTADASATNALTHSHINAFTTVSFGSHTLSSDTSRAQLHISQRLPGDSITPADGHLTVRKADDGIAWGAMYWQYFENIDKIPASAMGITIKRTLYKIDGDKLIPVTQQLKVGDRIRVRIQITADRNMEYLELKDPRCAAFEPVSTGSGWHWNGGLSFYLAVTNTAHTLYIDRIDKGSYVAEYDLYVNNAGHFSLAPAAIQCLYAPEFRALTPGSRLHITR